MKPTIQQKRISIEAGKQAEIRDERTDSLLVQHARSIVIHLHEGAKLSYRDVQQLSSVAVELTVMTVIMEAHSSFIYEGMHQGARLAKMHVHLVLQAEGATAQIRIGSLAQGIQRHTFYTSQHHLNARTSSTCLVRAVAFDASRVQYHGSITIEKQAVLSDAYQQHKAMIMGDQAHVDARPMLSIGTNDVRCGHGSAIGRFDEEHRYYLQSRGIDSSDTQGILVYSFFDELYTDAYIKRQLYQRFVQNNHDQ